MRAGCPRVLDRRDRPWAQQEVWRDECPVEVARERGDVGGKPLGELYGVPPVDFTTNAETSAICWSLSWPLNAGIGDLPKVTRVVASW